MNKSTPPSSSLPLPGTPVHTRSTTTDRIDPKYENRDITYNRLSKEMAPYFVGPIPPQEFLDQFLPLTSPHPSVPPFRSGDYSGLTGAASEREMYLNFANIFAPHLQSLSLVDTSRLKDQATYTKFSFACQPDCCVYSKESNHDQELHSSFVEFPIEFKTTPDQDPFVVNPPSHEGSTNENPFMSVTTQGQATAGQITAYATLILSAQYRTHIFLVLIVKDFARLIRWDRGGAVVTAPIYYDQDPHLLHFLVRYNNATREVRGHDPTVRLPTKDEDEDARRELGDLTHGKSLLTVTMSDPKRPQESCHYVICGPCARPDIPVGRWTRTSIAYDVQRQKRVLLKDSWRVFQDDITPEGEVYARLHQHSVPNTPHCSNAGDVGDNNYHVSRTHEYVDIQASKHFVAHRHYRLVLDTIGRKLENFKSSWEMVNAVHASLVAHDAACKAGVLHRDISVGNMMIVDKDESNLKGGMLIDWDLCKVTDLQGETGPARQHTRTGTWQFMAADVMLQPGIAHTFIHDLESAFWVIIWIIISYRPTSPTVEERSSFLKDTMSPRVYNTSGGRPKLDFLLATSGPRDFSVNGNPPLTKLLDSLRQTFAYRYQSRPSQPSDLHPSILLAEIDGKPGSGEMDAKILKQKTAEYERVLLGLENHELILLIFKKALAASEWPENDAAQTQEILVPNDVLATMRSSSKRSRSVAEDNGVFTLPPQAKRSEAA